MKNIFSPASHTKMFSRTVFQLTAPGILFKLVSSPLRRSLTEISRSSWVLRTYRLLIGVQLSAHEICMCPTCTCALPSVNQAGHKCRRTGTQIGAPQRLNTGKILELAVTMISVLTLRRERTSCWRNRNSLSCLVRLTVSVDPLLWGEVSPAVPVQLNRVESHNMLQNGRHIFCLVLWDPQMLWRIRPCIVALQGSPIQTPSGILRSSVVQHWVLPW